MDSTLSVDPGKCIICQQRISNLEPISRAEGKEKVRNAAKIRNDIVNVRLERLELIGGDFVYHMNNECYKVYTMKKTLEKISESLKENPVPIEIDEPDLPMHNESEGPTIKRTRSSLSPRESASSQKHITNLKCVICGKISHNNERKKYRISESPRAKKFLKIALAKQDDVYIRIADLESDTRVFGADLFYHSACLSNYLVIYDRNMNKSNNSKKREAFLERVTHIDELLENGMILPLSDIRDDVNEIVGENFISNKEIKLYLYDYFSDRIQFCNSTRYNSSILVYSSKLTTDDLVQKMSSLDNIRDTAEKIREALKSVDFKLQDRFCDAQELESSWQNTEMPECLVLFFSALFDIPQTSLTNTSLPNDLLREEESEDDISLEGNVNLSMKNRKRKVVKIVSMFQSMYYILHNGRKRTPLHVLAGHSIYETCKSRELLTSFNHVAACISYNEVRRDRSNLAKYSFLKSKDEKVPMPSHFQKNQFTVGAFDNFDSADRSSVTGTMSTHDTVSVLFQVKPQKTPKKPSISSLELDNGNFADGDRLPCQSLRDYIRPNKVLTIPSSFKVDENLLTSHYSEESTGDSEFLLNFIRSMAPSHIDTLPTWSGCHSLISRAQIPLMQVGFLPFIPHPVTEIQSVYTAMKNFLSVLDQIDQKSLPLVCDEGVYRIVTEIYLQRPDEFRNLVPMLGNFHMMKAFQHCIGKYLKGSGIEDALIETKTFGVNVVESVLNGTHYVRSMRGLLIISEVITIMQWEAFWRRHNRANFQIILDKANNCICALNERDAEASKERLDTCLNLIKPLKDEFERFCRAANESSEMCHYWSLVQQNIQILKNSLSSDRDAHWIGHLLSVQKMLPTFAECDGINYFRYASFYLEQMRRLPEDHPDLYAEFLEGKFVIKTNTGSFNAVAPDMKLEQTIQRAKKSQGGIIGQTKQVVYVTEWEAIYHEILAISYTFRGLTDTKIVFGDINLHHELQGHYSKVFNYQVKKMFDFINARGNPFLESKLIKLHNFVSGVSVVDEVADRFINFKSNSEIRYKIFRSAIFLERSRKLSDTITKSKFPRFTPLPQSKREISSCISDLQNNPKLLSKEVSGAQKEIDIARGRSFTLKEILRFDLTEYNPLFKGGLPAKPNKSELVSEIESRSDPMGTPPFSKNSPLNTALIVDFMSLIRSQTNQSVKTVGDLLKNSWNSAHNACSFQKAHVVYDSYIDRSLKECERERRSATEQIEYYDLNQSSILPVQKEKFWSSSQNKEQIQQLSRIYFGEIAQTRKIEFILSGYVRSDNVIKECTRIDIDGNVMNIDELKSQLEEADIRLIPHIYHSIQENHKRVVLISNDTDVVVLAIHYMAYFLQCGLVELWIRYGTGNKSRFLPIHYFAESLGHKTSSVILKAHILTGCDVTSKIGTKLGALNGNPEFYLTDFGVEDELTPEMACRAEEYLVHVWSARSKTKEKDFNGLRYSNYVSKKTTLVDLPPTSSSIHGHLERCHYVIRQYISLLDRHFDGNPCHYGWFEESGVLLPDKRFSPLPKFYTVRCGCKKKCTSKCSCIREEVECTEFCNCSKNCENS